MRESVQSKAPQTDTHLPDLLTIDDVARVLRTSRGAVYAMVARGQLPGLTRIGRRVLIRADALLDWLNQKRAPSPIGGR